MWRLFSVLMVFSGVVSHAVMAMEGGAVVQLDAFAYTQPVAYKEFIKDWFPPYYGGETAFQYINLETGIKYDSFKLTFFQKDYAELDFSQDTADFFYLQQHKESLEKNKTYQIELNAKYMSFRGIQGSIEFVKTKNLSASFGVAYLQGLKLLHGSLTGEVVWVSDRDYNISNGVLDYYYSDDDLLESDVIAPVGSGYSVDFSLNWNVFTWFDTSINAFNMLGSIHWDNAPYTRAQVDTGVKTYDENGYVRVEPAVHGQQGEERFVQDLPRLISVNNRLRLVKYLYGLSEIDITPLKTIVSFGFSVEPTSKIRLQVLYLTKLRAGSLRFMSKWFQIGVTADDFNYNKARVLGFNASINLTF